MLSTNKKNSDLKVLHKPGLYSKVYYSTVQYGTVQSCTVLCDNLYSLTSANEVQYNPVSNTDHTDGRHTTDTYCTTTPTTISQYDCTTVLNQARVSTVNDRHSLPKQERQQLLVRLQASNQSASNGNQPWPYHQILGLCAV